MCGIVGISTKDEKTGAYMLSQIHHRGPDWHATWSSEGMTLGHTLLSIRAKTEDSKQPVTQQHSEWVLVFNGQLYNIPEIKTLLPKEYENEVLDTKLLFALIEKKGWRFIEYIQGMFAIGLYNKKEKELRLYRDQSGQKTIYYTHGTAPFMFASEIRALLATNTIPTTPDTEGVRIAQSIGYIPGYKTLFAHIRKLQPGEVVTIRDTTSPSRAFFTTNTTSFENHSPQDALTETIALHLAAKKEVVLNLSGGLDSSVLLHEMSQLQERVHTYTTRFVSADDSVNTDADLAQQLAREYKTIHTEILITSELFKEQLRAAYETIEEPNYNISLPTYLCVAQTEGISGKGHRVVLSGDGGDELFGGYPFYKQALRYSLLGSRFSSHAVNLYKYLRDGMYWNFSNPIELWLRTKTLRTTAQEKNSIISYLTDILPPNYLATTDPVQQMMLLDRLFWLPNENFIRSDKLYMSQSLELRSPLAYPPLRTYFDTRYTAHDYFGDGTNKHALRLLYKNKLPDYIVTRKDKTGWRSPVHAWWDKEYKDLFSQTFSEAPRGTIDWNALSKKVQEQETWPGKRFHLYFSLAVLSKKYNLPL